MVTATAGPETAELIGANACWYRVWARGNEGIAALLFAGFSRHPSEVRMEKQEEQWAWIVEWVDMDDRERSAMRSGSLTLHPETDAAGSS
jgi:hypothetical protein